MIISVILLIPHYYYAFTDKNRDLLMEISQDKSTENYIHGYHDQQIKINDSIYTSSLILTPSQIITPWINQEIVALSIDDFKAIIELSPEIVIVGNASSQQIDSQAITIALSQQGIGAEFMGLGPACRTYNVLMLEKRKVVAAFLFDHN